MIYIRLKIQVTVEDYNLNICSLVTKYQLLSEFRKRNVNYQVQIPDLCKDALFSDFIDYFRLYL